MFVVMSAISTALVISFCLYVMMILVPFLRRKPEKPGDPTSYEWHFFVPCRDEEAVIDATMDRLRHDFPYAHVWVIDDDSDDSTASLVTQRARQDDHVHLVQRRRPEARIGKGAALNAAYGELAKLVEGRSDLDRVIVCVVDADGQLAPNALAQVSSPTVFGDPQVGAAQLTVWMRNRDDKRPFPNRGWFVNAGARYLLRMQDVEFRTTIVAMQALRERTSTVGLGGNGQFTRFSVLDAIRKEYGEPWHGSLLEDYELGVHVLLAGYTNKHVYDSHVSQEALPDVRRLLTQRTRWSQGNIQCVRYIRQIVLSPKIDNAGMLESTYYLILPFMQLIGFVTWTFMLTWGIVQIATGSAVVAEVGSFTMWSMVALFLLFGIGPFFLWGPIYRHQCEPTKPWWAGILWGIGMWLYVFYMYISLSRAFARVILRREGWLKTRRNAETHSIGVVAKDS